MRSALAASSAYAGAGVEGGSSRRCRRLPVCRASKGVDSAKLDQAAARFSKGVRQGDDPEELIARELGAARSRELSDVQDKYKDKLRDKLAERAVELERQKAARQRMFAQGKAAYARGAYPESTRAFELALNDEGPFSLLGGEIQLWLALAYQAEGREQECIDTYKRVEQTHPSPKIKRQAADLRYIMEAPKLAVSREERVEIPVLGSMAAAKRGAKASTSLALPGKPMRKYKKSLEEEFLDNYTPPGWTGNYYVWAASAVVGAGLAVASAYLGK